MVSSGVARGYITSETQRAQLNTSCDVVLLDKETEMRAEGQLKHLEKTENRATANKDTTCILKMRSRFRTELSASTEVASQ
jgi:hypothetical protein